MPNIEADYWYLFQLCLLLFNLSYTISIHETARGDVNDKEEKDVCDIWETLHELCSLFV